MISLIHPSRGRPDKSRKTIDKWLSDAAEKNIEVNVVIDSDDNWRAYFDLYPPYPSDANTPYIRLYMGNHRSAIDAINRGAMESKGNILIVVSDDTDCFPGWDTALLKEVEGKTDFILKTQDGIQPWIITMPVLDRAYHNRFGYIYHPDFQHMFCDTYMSCVADINGRKLTSDLMFKHNHYSVGKEAPDEINKKNDATWRQGEETFIRLMKEFTITEREWIDDPGMRRWLRNKGV